MWLYSLKVLTVPCFQLILSPNRVVHNLVFIKILYIYIYVCDICTCNSVMELTLKDNCHKELWTKSGMLKIPFLFWGYEYTCQNNWLKMRGTQSINQLCCLHHAKQPAWLIFVPNQINWLTESSKLYSHKEQSWSCHSSA